MPARRRTRTVRSVKTASRRPGPKFYGSIVAAVVTYLLTQTVLDLPTWADLLLNAAAVGLAVYTAPPQATRLLSRGVSGFAFLPVAAAGGDVHLLFLLIVVLFLLAAVYVAVRLREYVGAVVLVLLALVVAIFLL